MVDLKAYKSKSLINVKTLEEKLEEFDFYTSQTRDVGLFNFNKINNNAYHIIFYIKEEYHTRTKYVEKINRIPMDIYINTFLLIDKNYILIERLYDEYFSLIINKYYELFGVKCEEFKIQNQEFIHMIDNKVKNLLHCDINIDGYIKEVENKEEIYEKLEEGNSIDFITFTLKNESFNNIITSISKDAIITSKATIPAVLIDIIMDTLG